MGMKMSKRGFGYMSTSKKVCQFPGCGEEFEGVGSAKFCPTHRDKASRKIIFEINKENKKEERKKELKEKRKEENNYDKSNITIEHSYIEPTKISRTCVCGKDYEITLYSKVDKYPAFCPEHRNPYKRELMLKKLNKDC